MMDQPPPSRTEAFRVDDAHRGVGIDRYLLRSVPRRTAHRPLRPPGPLHIRSDRRHRLLGRTVLGARLLVAVCAPDSDRSIDRGGLSHRHITFDRVHPKKYRGPFIGALTVMWFVGAAAAYVVGDVLTRVSDQGWRWMLASAAVPAALTVLARIGTPESPRGSPVRGASTKPLQSSRRSSARTPSSRTSPGSAPGESARSGSRDTSAESSSSPRSGPQQSCRCSRSTPSARTSSQASVSTGEW